MLSIGIAGQKCVLTCSIKLFFKWVKRRKEKEINQENVFKTEYIFSETSLIFLECMLELAAMS